MVFIVEAIASAVLSASLQVLFDRLSPRTNLIEFFRRHEFDDILLEDLETAMLQVNAVLSDAEEKQIINPFVRQWIDDLKDAAYHTADLLDEINSLALAEHKSQEDSKSKLDKRIKESKSRLKKMTLKLQNIVKHKDVLGLKESYSGKPSPRLQSTSLVKETKVYGRENDKEKILHLLLSDNNAGGQDILVVAIIGIAGVGKTTLAQLLYNDSNVQKHFPKRAWVYVSEDFDVFKVTKTLYESVTNQQCDVTDLNMLQVKLKEELNGEKFLFILDDVWNEYYSKWDVLQNFLIAGTSKSRIIVTTRSQGVASTMRAIHSCHLRPLEDKDCWLVFANHAFGSSLHHAPSNLKLIGQEIMKKCRGLPLAAKVLGSLLYSKVQVHEWENILSSNIWDLPNDKSDILHSLRLSYYYLSSPLKQCFAYCSIFPKGFEFDKEKLVQLWMAEGFLQQRRSGRTLEEVGIEYFHELLSRSFFQHAGDDNKSYFAMHDLIIELAQFASSESCFKFEKGKSHSISRKARHFSYVIDQFDDSNIEKFDALNEAKFLRTFLPLSCSGSGGSCSINRMVVHELLPKQKRLRVLSLSHYGNINKLPGDFKKLLHLRYLDFSHNAITELPKSIVCLFNLQTLILSYCIQLIELPANMGNLNKLVHLDLNGTKSLERMPLKFGRLKSLQILTTFVVGNSTKGSSICELGGLLLLRGKLSILELQNVKDVEDAENTKLKDKKNIKELEFNWSSNGQIDKETILEKLYPHENIEKLSIAGFSGSRLPDWLGDSSFSKMVILQLSDCRNCPSLPSLGQLPSLQELSVKNMPVLESVGVDFYGNASSSFASLGILKFYDMPRWKEWSPSAVTGEGFPLLQKLHIWKCENLSRLPNCFPSLEELDISECSKLEPVHIRSCNHLEEFTLNFSGMLKILEIHDCKDLRIINISRNLHQHLNFLQELKISECHNMESFSGRGLPAPNLKTFSVSNCNKLKSMPEQMHTLLSSLQTLKISGCPKLVSFPDGGLPLSLQTLTIQNCVNLTPLDAWGLRNMTSLTRLTIECENANVTSFPDEGLLPASLTSLEINGFPVLKILYLGGLQHLILLNDLHINCTRLHTFSDGKLPSSLSSLRISGCSSLTDLCLKDQGDYWDKISHIPVKVINGIQIN
ncbi:hypothetical protein Ddye_031712 [Dipteronia dyeriana]|uniref:Uncharacterized protein n=1 Tax=Dipteronia dyeriana TaxID=168575 RepID=A0AAD9TIV5_9ROSI|nr:hypothetical protein Ddye_031712 [Dipteronia dyeriana]